jgi:hypothetical protein
MKHAITVILLLSLLTPAQAQPKKSLLRKIVTVGLTVATVASQVNNVTQSISTLREVNRRTVHQRKGR